ncbi:Increased rDNA silencing protein [Vermiconidia calcicola]|uniref:Increased rDNA silencing protein n=1 Tax=Vermiconidia calcicola TaxID=1690605 RepID=A0ACC3MUA7_9PEZI|nr:Increased rDNA silencing protein [Vermiconidia calcicola]
MTAPRHPSCTSTFGSQATPSNPQNAALLGAATAFGRPAGIGRGSNNAYTGKSGALAAATRAERGSNTTRPQHGGNSAQTSDLLPNSTGGGRRTAKSYADRDLPSLGLSTTPNLGLPAQPQRGHAKSPPQQAASLAAAKAPPPPEQNAENSPARRRVQSSKEPNVAPKPRRLSRQIAQSDEDKEEMPTDFTPISTTTSLVDMFERKASISNATCKRPEPLVGKPSNDLAIKSPKPVRTSGGITSMFRMELEEGDRSAKPAATGPARQSSDASNQIQAVRSLSSASASEDLTIPSSPLPGTKRTPPSLAASNPDDRTGMRRVRSHPSPLRNPTSDAINIPKLYPGNASSPPERFSPSSASVKSIPAQYNQLYPRKVTPNMTGDQLVNAMVAGSLASSRAPSPHKEQPPPPPTRRPKFKSALSFSRTPSPTKTGMRHTLRKAGSDSSDEEEEERLHPYGKHKKKRHLRKHPNKHNEGDRKRWRDAVTERERKRYEGVWAANKGLYCSLTVQEELATAKAPDTQRSMDIRNAMADQVSSIVVRDIWNRSRLPETALELVWDLVDNQNVGRLTKTEFVVGLWLIDQRLKGRKLPVKVGDSVWASVKSLQGIKIRK